jgi:hypothetical protein
LLMGIYQRRLSAWVWGPRRRLAMRRETAASHYLGATQQVSGSVSPNRSPIHWPCHVRDQKLIAKPASISTAS